MSRKSAFTMVCCVQLISLYAFAQTIQTIKADPGNNNPPPVGAILDLSGTPIPGGGDAATYQQYSVSFTASLSSTAITFAFRDDPAFISFVNASVMDLTTNSGNLLVNGDFSQGTYTDNGNAFTPNDWMYANQFGATSGGLVQSQQSLNCSTFSFCWYDGAVQAYDAISQVIPTTAGDQYQITFSVAENSNCGTCKFSAVSTNGDTTDTGGNGIDVTVYAQGGLPASSEQTGQPMNPDNSSNLNQQFTFNSTTGKHVEFDFDYLTAFTTNGDLTVQSNTLPTVIDQGITQAIYQQMVAGTAMATTSCFTAPGQGVDSSGNPLCAKMTLECTTQNNPTPAGDSCPQSLERNLLFTQALDTPISITIPPGTGASFAEGSDDWVPGTCTFNGPEAGELCPQNFQTRLTVTADPQPKGGGTGKTSNSTFIAGCCEPEWSTVATVPLYSNNTTVPVSFTSSPPGAPPQPNNGWVAAPNRSISWGSEALGSTPDPTFPLAGDQTVENQISCPSAWPTGGTVPPNATASGTVTVAGEGAYEVHFFTTACDGQEELLYTQPDDPTKNWAAFKTAPFNVDLTAPSVTGFTLNPPPINGTYQLNQIVTASLTCTDPLHGGVASGIAICGPGATNYHGQNPVAVVNVPVDTSTLGAHAFGAKDVAGNAITTQTYTVVNPPADMATVKIGPSIAKTGTTAIYLIGAWNQGPAQATQVVISDTLPSGESFVSATYALVKCTNTGCSVPPPGSVPCSFSNNTVSCSVATLASVAKGQTIFTGVGVKLVVKVTARSGTAITNTAKVSAANPDPNLANNSFSWFTRVK